MRVMFAMRALMRSTVCDCAAERVAISSGMSNSSPCASASSETTVTTSAKEKLAASCNVGRTNAT